MAKTDIKLNATDPSGKTTTTSVTYVNPEATNAQLKQLGQMLNAMTENVYESTYRINTIHCDSEAGGGAQTATLQVWGGDADISSGFIVNRVDGTVNRFIKYDGDASNVYVDFDPADPNLMIAPGALNNGSLPANMNAAQANVGNYTLHIYAPATNNFKAASLDVPVTVA